jgi:hypothetical protein
LDEGGFSMPEEDVWVEAAFSEAQAVSFRIDKKAVKQEDYWQWSAGGAWSADKGGYAVPGSQVIVSGRNYASYLGWKPVFSISTESGADVPFVEEDTTFRYSNCWAATFTMPDEPVIVTIDAVLMDMEELHLGENVLTITERSESVTFTPEETGEYRFTRSSNAYLGAFLTMTQVGVIGSAYSGAKLVGGETYVLDVGRTVNEPTQVTVTVERLGDIETGAVIIADDMEYGTIEATVPEAPAGHYVQLKAVPGSCSEFVSIHASWEGGDINLRPVSGEELTYSFSMPPGDVTVSAEFTAPAHVWSDGVVTAPTCTEIGGTTYTCTVCGETRTENVTDALGHIWGEPEWIWAADGSSASATFTCTRDAAHTETLDAAVTIDGNNYTASVEFEGTPYTNEAYYVLELALGENVVHYSLNFATHTFTPAESGWYSFVSSAPYNTDIWIYDPVGWTIGYDNTWDEFEARTCAQMEAGKTYTVDLRSWPTAC